MTSLLGGSGGLVEDVEGFFFDAEIPLEVRYFCVSPRREILFGYSATLSAEATPLDLARPDPTSKEVCPYPWEGITKIGV